MPNTPIIPHFVFLLLYGSSLLDGQPDFNTVDQMSLAPAVKFKRFTASPPAVKELVYCFELPPSALSKTHDRGTNSSTNNAYVQVRWQQDAFCYRKVQALYDLGKALPIGTIVGRSHAGCWFIRPRDGVLFLTANVSASDDPLDFVAGYAEATSDDVARILNMGIEFLPVGSIQWNGNTFSTTSQRHPVRVTGTLFTNSAGYVETMRVRYASGRHSTEVVIHYDYADAPVDYLPSRLRKCLLHDGQEIEADQWSILKLELSARPQSQDVFSPRPYLCETGLEQRTYKQGCIYARDRKGQLQLAAKVAPAKQWAYFRNYSESIRHGVYLTLFVVISIAIIISMMKLRALRKRGF